MPFSAKTLHLKKLIPDFLHFLENQKSCSLLTIKAYKKDLEQAFCSEEYLNPHDLLPLSRQAQSAWGTLSLSSRNRKTATLKSFLGWLYENKKIEKPIGELLIGPKVPKKIPDFISVDEVMTVIKHFEKIDSSNELTLFLLLYGGGLRISEACQLMWKDCNLNSRSLRIKGKGGKERIVILPQICIEQLNRHKKNNTEYIFGASALNPRVGYEWIRQMGVQCHLLHSLHPHSLRHSFATHMLAGGANLRTLQKLLGHESLQATEKYTHLNVDQLARTLESKHPLSKLKVGKS